MEHSRPSFFLEYGMYSPNELLTEYGRECRKRHDFWERLGVPKKQRAKFVRWVYPTLTCSKFVEENLDEDVDFLIDLYEDYKKEKEKMAGFDSASNTHFIDVPGWVVQGQFVNSTATYAQSLTGNGWHTVSKEEENMDTTYDQRRHLERRLNQVNADHTSALQSHFHMNGDFPATVREALDRLANGKVKYPSADTLEARGYNLDGSFYNHILFDDIDWTITEADKAGFNAASKVLDKAYTETLDSIRILDPKDGLAALKEFEAKTFH